MVTGFETDLDEDGQPTLLGSDGLRCVEVTDDIATLTLLAILPSFPMMSTM